MTRDEHIQELTERLAKLDDNIKSTHKTMRSKECEVNSIRARKVELTDRRTELTRKLGKLKKEVTVSEHAILRYTQRVLDIGVDDIVDDTVREEIDNINGNGEFEIEYTDGSKHKFIIKGYNIVTVI